MIQMLSYPISKLYFNSHCTNVRKQQQVGRAPSANLIHGTHTADS